MVLLPVRISLAMFLLAMGYAAAQPASDLLQSGIFSQDTLGDVDGAIRIYRQILAGGPGMRLYAAQAHFRLGTALVRKGDVAGATRAFEAVIRNYPDERELVARARESMPRGDGLLPAPWGDSEVAEYRWSIPGVDEGWSISRIGSSQSDRRILRIRTNFYAPQLNATMVDVDGETMRPISAMYRGPAAQNARTPEGAGVFRIAPAAMPGTYALGELWYLLRRMPLTEGWSASIPLLSPGALSRTALVATVTGTENITVPGGAFKCYKVSLTANAKSPPPRASSVGPDWPRTTAGETLWYAIDGARTLVKIESGNARGELTGLRTGETAGTTSYRDSRVGYSFTLPAGWVFHARNAMDGEGSSVDLIDPESQAVVVIAGKTKKTPPERIEEELRSGAATLLGRNPGTTTRSYTPHRLGGHQAITWIQDHANGNRIGYATWVQSESTRVSIRCQMEAAELDNFLRRFQPILDSFRMP